MFYKKIFLLILTSGLFYACKSEPEAYYPKPKGYERIELPPHAYQSLEAGHPYSFEYSKSAVAMPDQTPESEPHWIILKYPNLNALIQFTYKPLNGDLAKLSQHIDDAYKLAGKHQVKASSQEVQQVRLKNGKTAVIIELTGEVPSHYQFYLTDTSQHFLRGAVYLNQATLNDSLAPVVDYLKEDCKHILETLKWK